MKSDNFSYQLNVLVHPDIIPKLDEMANRLKWTRSQVVREILDGYFGQRDAAKPEKTVKQRGLKQA